MTNLYIPILLKDILVIQKDWKITLNVLLYEQNNRFYNKCMSNQNAWNLPEKVQVTLPSGIHLISHRYRFFSNSENSNAILKIVHVPEEIKFYWGMKFNQMILKSQQKICVSIKDLNILDYKLVKK